MTEQPTRWAWAEVDLGAYAHNLGVMRRIADGSSVWVVVKANAYGHGVVPIAREAVAAGVDGLCVALVSEGVELRRAGIDSPILIFSEQPEAEIDDIVGHGLIPTVYRTSYIERLADAVRRAASSRLDVHLKIDTGMARLGVPLDAVSAVGQTLAAAPHLRVAGVMSGTSLDGIDVAIVDVHGGRKTRVETVAFRMHAYPANVRAAILSVSDTMTHTSAISRTGSREAVLVVPTVAMTHSGRLPMARSSSI